MYIHICIRICIFVSGLVASHVAGPPKSEQVSSLLIGTLSSTYSVMQWETTVSFHNFKSQKFKLSVSNPKNKYVAYLSVLSQISNCQGLGRKNKHEISKTDRTDAWIYQVSINI